MGLPKQGWKSGENKDSSWANQTTQNCHYRESNGLREKLTHGGGSPHSKGPSSSSRTMVLLREALGPLVFTPSPPPSPQALAMKLGQAASARSSSSTPPTATTAKANASGLSQIGTPTFYRASGHHAPRRFPPQHPWDPPHRLLSQHCFVTWIKFLHQPVCLRHNCGAESTSVPVPGKQQQNWLGPGKTEV